MADFDPDGFAVESTIEWQEETLDAALRHIEEAGGRKCGMFLFADISEARNLPHTFGFYFQRSATREQFSQDPARYGVCYYKQPFYGGQYVFE